MRETERRSPKMSEVQVNFDVPDGICPSCGLPMSIVEDATHPRQWYCDGPNDRTDQQGCYSVHLDEGMIRQMREELETEAAALRYVPDGRTRGEAIE